MIIGDIRANMATFLGRNTVNDFTLNGIDVSFYALNAARRKAERLRDFYYARANPLLSIGTGGGLLTAAYESGGTVTITGTLSPNIATTFAPTGTYNGTAFFTATVSSVLYFLFFTGSAWQIRPGGFSGSNGWNRTTTSLDPSGTFTATGTSTGTATVAAGTTAPTIKRVTGVNLPITSPDYVPCEFLTAEEWQDRVRRQTGRTPYSPTATLTNIGVSSGNPVAYQDGQRIFLVPASQFTFPVVVSLRVYRFLPDYSADSDHDFFCDIAPEYLQWQAILEANKYFRRFIDKQESNVNEAAVEAMAQEALQTLLLWDNDITKDTSTPAGETTVEPAK